MSCLTRWPFDSDNWVSAEYGVGFNDGPGSFVVSSGTMNIQNYDVDVRLALLF